MYSKWLLTLHKNSSGGSDLVAHFFRRAFDLLRDNGALGLIATNTIAQGDTRASGLRWICQHGGEIYCVRKTVRWPGPVSVVVSVVHVMKGPFSGQKHLDNRPVETITAFLFHDGSNDDPSPLATNAGKSFQGSIVLGMGFTFDDTDSTEVATPLAVMRGLIEKDPSNAECIFPYIGGAEVNASPTHAPNRYVINFGERSEDECRRRWPDLMEIVEAKVKPERITKDPKKYPRMVHEWWKFWNARPELLAASVDLERVLVTSTQAYVHWALAFQPPRRVFAHSLVVITEERFGSFCALQARVHEIWARFFSGTALTLSRYNPSDCFVTFPFPADWQVNSILEAVGREYYEFRASVMVKNDQGLTETYNHFHDPDEHAADILKLRDLHGAMDRAVLDAYGWNDVPTGCQFLLDYEIDEAERGNKKKPYRYRWPDDVRDDVLARLIKLNAERAAEEQRSGASAGEERAARAPGAGRTASKPRATTGPALF